MRLATQLSEDEDDDSSAGGVIGRKTMGKAPRFNGSLSKGFDTAERHVEQVPQRS